MFTFPHFRFLSTSIWLLYFWLLPITTNYERQTSPFQGLKNCKLIFFGFIEQIFIFHGRFAAFKTNFKHICWIEMSTDKK